MKIIELKDKHPLIYKRILEINQEQKRTKIDALHNQDIMESFSWIRTGNECFVWQKIYRGNYQSFYDYYSLPNPENVKGDFYNTTNLQGKELNESKEKALSQTQLLLNRLPIGQIFSAWTLYDSHALPLNTPITSYRRAIFQLHEQGKIEVVGQRIGNLGKKEFTYKLIL